MNCVDILRILYTDTMICKCSAPGHDGEPTAEQILDPETGDVYAKGLIIRKNGGIDRG